MVSYERQGLCEFCMAQSVGEPFQPFGESCGLKDLPHFKMDSSVP